MEKDFCQSEQVRGFPTLVFYRTGLGVTVTSLAPGSSALGPSGLDPGQVITAVQGRPVTTRREFSLAVASLLSQPQAGLCLGQEEVTVEDIVPGLAQLTMYYSQTFLDTGDKRRESNNSAHGNRSIV